MRKKRIYLEQKLPGLFEINFRVLNTALLIMMTCGIIRSPRGAKCEWKFAVYGKAPSRLDAHSKLHFTVRTSSRGSQDAPDFRINRVKASLPNVLGPLPLHDGNVDQLV